MAPTSVPTVTVTGVMFDDTNGNGIMKDGGESSLPGAVDVITDDDGHDGEYSAVVPPGKVETDIDENTCLLKRTNSGYRADYAGGPSGQIAKYKEGFQNKTGAPTLSPTVSTGSPTKAPKGAQTKALVSAATGSPTKAPTGAPTKAPVTATDPLEMERVQPQLMMVATQALLRMGKE